MAGGFACYHHCNDHDRAAVATCSRCGKALCAECTDAFRSRKTGEILCIECLNAEIANNERVYTWYAAQQKKEMIMMIVGGIIGLILAIALTGSMGSAAVFGYLYLPFLLASIGLIWEKSFGSHGFIIGAICFIGMALVSPIMFVIRILNRVKMRKTLAQMVAYNQKARKTNDKFFKYARSIKSGLTAAEMTKIVYQLQTAQTQMVNAQREMQKAKDDLARAKESGDPAMIAECRKMLEKCENENAALNNKVNNLQTQMDTNNAENKAEQKKMLSEVRDMRGELEDITAATNMMASKKKSA